MLDRVKRNKPIIIYRTVMHENHVNHTPPGCDFCDSNRRATWRYRAHDIVIFEEKGTRAKSESDWAACEDCHRLIESGDRNKLLDHAVRLIGRKWSVPITDPVVRRSIQKIHDKFFEARFRNSIAEKIT